MSLTEVLGEIAVGSDAELTVQADTLADTLQMWRQARPRQPLPLFHSADRVLHAHDELTTLVDRSIGPDGRPTAATRSQAASCTASASYSVSGAMSTPFGHATVPASKKKRLK